MTKRLSNAYAPEGTCPRCGWTGRDWGFKYRNLCKRCHKQWRKKKAEEERKYNPKTNVEVAAGVIVTSNVHQRLEEKAGSDVPYTRTARWAGYFMVLGPLLPATGVGVMYVLGVPLPYEKSTLWIVCIAAGLFIGRIARRIDRMEDVKRKPNVGSRLEDLARDRQQRIDEANAFYASAEWRVVREEVIKEQGRVCQQCGRRMRTDFDLTVDHIKPRSRFPQLALDKSNLQVLCRRCNSSKGATYDESSMTLETRPEVPAGSAERV